MTGSCSVVTIYLPVVSSTANIRIVRHISAIARIRLERDAAALSLMAVSESVGGMAPLIGATGASVTKIAVGVRSGRRMRRADRGK